MNAAVDRATNVIALQLHALGSQVLREVSARAVPYVAKVASTEKTRPARNSAMLSPRGMPTSWRVLGLAGRSWDMNDKRATAPPRLSGSLLVWQRDQSRWPI